LLFFPQLESLLEFSHISFAKQFSKILFNSMKKIIIRPETHADIQAIREVTIAAFNTLDISSHTEQFIIDALRRYRKLTISLVAELNGKIAGHIAFSPITISDGTKNWYGLGPVSVLPELQKQGIGKALIIEGLRKLKEMGASGCMLAGHPDYYPKFGFKNIPSLVHEGVPPEAFFVLPFSEVIPEGKVEFHSSFMATM
jgi:putative acetyltransferase